MYQIFLLTILINICLSIKCDVICSNNPCSTIVMTTRTYQLDILGENGCIFDLIYVNTPTIIRDNLIFDNQINKKKNNELEKYNLIIKSFKMKYGEKSCSANPLLGLSSEICLGESNDTYSLLKEHQIFSLYNFFENDFFDIETIKNTNVSIISDLNRQIEIITTLLFKITNKQGNNPLNGLITLSDGSTYNINSVIPSFDDLLGLPYKINYHFLKGLYEYCSLFNLNPNDYTRDLNYYCDECMSKTTNFYLKNVATIDVNVCRSIIRNNFSLSNNTMMYGFTFVIKNNDIILPSTYKVQTSIVKKIDIELKPYLNFCFIKIVNITNDLERVYCSIIGKVSKQVLHEKIYNGYIRLYKNFTRILPNCVNVELLCQTTIVNYFYLPYTEIIQKDNEIIGQDKKVLSSIGWWLWLKQWTSLMFEVSLSAHSLICIILSFLTIYFYHRFFIIPKYYLKTEYINDNL